MYLEDEDITKEAYLASGFYSLIFLLYAGCFFSDKSFKFCCSTICVPNLFFFVRHSHQDAFVFDWKIMNSSNFLDCFADISGRTKEAFG
jgi:hypothetical protein